MFELIGLLFATMFLFILAAITAAILAGTTWLLVRKSSMPRKRVVVIASLIPFASAAYFWVCIALLPDESLFGDISQPLPNGYTLKALGKMPDFASIDKTDSPLAGYNVLSQCVGRLAVYGPLVVGQYSHPFGTFDVAANEPFFIFDTRNGQHTELPTLASLQAALGHSVSLTETQSFRSQEPAYRRQKSVNRAAMFGPPIIALGILTVYILRRRVLNPSFPPNIYT
jgi:hypothetical protein